MERSERGARWYRQPILWLGFAILLASLAGCVSLIVLGARYADEPLPVESTRLLKMPTAHSTAPGFLSMRSRTLVIEPSRIDANHRTSALPPMA